MLHFLNPIWLAGTAGIVVPLIIHLWNIRKGKVLKIGSTLLIAESSQKSASSFRITQWLLLILRCLLIIMLSMLLASPQWRETLIHSNKGWVIIDQPGFGSLYRQFKIPVDSLLQNGFELHRSVSPFQAVTMNEALSDTAAIESDSLFLNATADSTANESIWKLISRLDTQLPGGFTVFLFTGNTMGRVTGSPEAIRPTISLDLRWSMANEDTNVLSIPVAANDLASGMVRSSFLNSGLEGSFFSHLVNNAPQMAATNISTDTSTMDIAIYSDKYAEDARYLAAAISAIADFSQRKLRLTSVQNKAQVPVGQDWVFWLTEEGLPQNIQAKNIFRYGSGNEIAAKSWLVAGNGPLPENSIAIYKYTGTKSLATNGPGENKTASPASGVDNDRAADASGIIWKNGYGDPILTVDETIGGNKKLATNKAGEQTENAAKDYTDNHQDNFNRVYTFYSRINPGWTELPWSPAFPKMLLPLILKDTTITNIEKLQRIHDRRAVAVADVMPLVVRNTYKTAQTAFNAISLNKLVWLLAFLLFAAERIIALNGSKFNKRKTSDL